MAKKVETDLSSFMAVILMFIGILMIMLVSNVLTIVSNPENFQISTMMPSGMYEDGVEAGSGLPRFANKEKEPVYVDVYPNRMIIYPEQEIVLKTDLQKPGNAFEKLLQKVGEAPDEEYVILLARPGSAKNVSLLRRTIRDRGIDVGVELFEAGRPVTIEKAAD